MKFVILSLVLIFTISLNLSAQWQKSKGKYSDEEVFCFLNFNKRIYAGCNNKIIISSDASIWNECISNFNGKVDYISNYNNVLYAASDFVNKTDGSNKETIEIKTSNDYGEHWNLINSLEINTAVNCFLFKDSLFLIGTMTGLYISNDFGKTWNKKKFNKDRRITCIIAHNNKIFVGLRGELIYTNDRFVTWNKVVIEDMPIANISDLVFVDNNLFIATADIGVFKLNLESNKFQSLKDEVLSAVIWNLHQFSCNTFIATSQNEGVFYSSIENQWNIFNEGLPKNMEEYNPIMNSILINNKLVIGLTNHGIWHRNIKTKLE